jgi:hypothetical protein
MEEPRRTTKHMTLCKRTLWIWSKKSYHNGGFQELLTVLQTHCMWESEPLCILLTWRRSVRVSSSRSFLRRYVCLPPPYVITQSLWVAGFLLYFICCTEEVSSWSTLKNALHAKSKIWFLPTSISNEHTRCSYSRHLYIDCVIKRNYC